MTSGSRSPSPTISAPSPTIEATDFTTAWITFANRRKGWAYVADQLPTTHPIVADIPNLEAAKQNFDGITYAKGASVLKQLGRLRWRGGIPRRLAEILPCP